LTCCVPYLKTKCDVRIFRDDDFLGEEICADGGMLDFFKVVVDEALEEGRFAYTLCAEDDYFCYIPS